MYCVMQTSMPSLYNVYRRYDNGQKANYHQTTKLRVNYDIIRTSTMLQWLFILLGSGDHRDNDYYYIFYRCVYGSSIFQLKMMRWLSNRKI